MHFIFIVGKEGGPTCYLLPSSRSIILPSPKMIFYASRKLSLQTQRSKEENAVSSTSESFLRSLNHIFIPFLFLGLQRTLLWLPWPQEWVWPYA